MAGSLCLCRDLVFVPAPGVALRPVAPAKPGDKCKWPWDGGNPEMEETARREMVTVPLSPPEEGRPENLLFRFVFVPLLAQADTGGALEAQNWTEPAEMKVSWTGPPETKVSWAGPAETKVSWAGPAETKVSWAGPAETKESWMGPSLGGAWEALTLGGAREALTLRGALVGWTEPEGALECWTEPAGALECWMEPRGALESWMEPAGVLESTYEESALEGTGEESALEGTGEESALEGTGEERTQEGAGEEPELEGTGEERPQGGVDGGEGPPRMSDQYELWAAVALLHLVRSDILSCSAGSKERGVEESNQYSFIYWPTRGTQSMAEDKQYRTPDTGKTKA